MNNNNLNNVNPFLVKSGVEEIPFSTYYPDRKEEEKVYRELYGINSTTNATKALIPKKDY